MRNSYYAILSVLIILLSWYLIADLMQLSNQLLLPGLMATSKEFYQALGSSFYWQDLYSTFYRWMLGLIIGGGSGILTGLVLGKCPKLYNFLEVPLEFLRSLPVSALFPLYLLLFGIGDQSKIALSATIAFLFLMINAYYGVRYAEPERAMAAKLMGANPVQLFFTVTIFEALPAIFVGLRLTVSLSLLATIVAEMFIGSDNGIGYRIYESYLTSASALLFVMIISAGIAGYTLNKILLLSEKRVIFWIVK